MRDARIRPNPRRVNRPGRGFTLTELLVVIAIIGILMALILVAAQDGVRRAEEKATLSLITKLESGVAERFEAVLVRRADVFLAHYQLAAIYNNSAPVDVQTGLNDIPAPQRAQVIAQYDLVKAEFPDVFFYADPTGPYPLNFAAQAYPLGSNNYGVPLGTSITPTGTSLGVYGATYQAAAGIYKNLGYLPAGYDGTDNNSNGAIDDIGEGTGGNASVQAAIEAKLASHTHNTARSEMLYALLVEGSGPLGSVFTRDEFTQREVADTDGDGLPEFIDAWGQPLQFYRWPIYYNGVGSNGSTSSYVQKGADAYAYPYEVRQTDPLDPGQSLVAPAWFYPSSNHAAGGGSTYSGGAAAFTHLFSSLFDPNFANAPGAAWDRSGYSPRRAYYSRFLILSGGPDQQPGVAQLNFNYSTIYSIGDGSGAAVGLSAVNLIQIENQAAQMDPNRHGNFLEQEVNPGTNNTSAALRISGQDDITNQGLASPGGGVQ